MAAAEIAEATEALARLRPQLLALNRFGFRVWSLTQRGAYADLSCDSVISSASQYDDWPLEPNYGWISHPTPFQQTTQTYSF